MFLSRASTLVVLSTLGAALGTVAAQSADKQRICNQIEHRTFTVGNWATYNWAGEPNGGSTLRMAVVGKESHDSTTYYWYEVTLEDPQRPNARMILQTLVPSFESKAAVRFVIFKSGDQPAMKMPPQMMQMVNSMPGMNVTAEIARGCAEMDAIGWDDVSVPAGHFHALHLKQPRTAMEVWVQPDLEFAMVKGILKDAGTLELKAQGTGAKSSITETPVAMPGLPTAPPHR
jgi:hypothetical protein